MMYYTMQWLTCFQFYRTVKLSLIEKIFYIVRFEIQINYAKFEFQFLSHISHISSAEKPYVAGVYSIGQSISLQSGRNGCVHAYCFLPFYILFLHKGLYCFSHNYVLCLCRGDHNSYNQSRNDGYLNLFLPLLPFYCY